MMSPYRICQIVGWSLVGLLTAVIPMLFDGLRWPVVVRAVQGAAGGIGLANAVDAL